MREIVVLVFFFFSLSSLMVKKKLSCPEELVNFILGIIKGHDVPLETHIPAAQCKKKKSAPLWRLIT